MKVSPIFYATLAVGVLCGCGTQVPVTLQYPSETLKISADQQCDIQRISESRLTVGDSWELYVEPNALVASGGELLLAGSPSYLWRRDSDGALHLEPQDSVFGVVISESGAAKIVAAPVASRLIGGVRAIPLNSGSWSVVFAEMTPDYEFPRPGKVARLWYGVLRGREWESLEQVPYPEGVQFDFSQVSNLLGRGGALAIAIPVALPQGLGGVVFLERRFDGSWVHEVIDAPGATYATLSLDTERGYALGIVQADLSIDEGFNALFLYFREDHWKNPQRIIRGENGSVFLPSLTLGREARGVLTYSSEVPSDGGRSEGRALLHPQSPNPDVRAIVVDSSSIGLFPIIARNGGVVWVSDHVALGGEREIHVISGVGGDSLIRRRFSSPYEGPFVASFGSDDEVVLAGPFVEKKGDSVLLTTLLLRVRLSCVSAAP